MGATPGATVAITTNYTSGIGSILAADQSGNTGQLVGHTFFGGVHFVAAGVALSAVVVQGGHAGDADGNLVQALAPSAAKTVGDDDGNVERGALPDSLQKLCG